MRRKDVIKNIVDNFKEIVFTKEIKKGDKKAQCLCTKCGTEFIIELNAKRLHRFPCPMCLRNSYRRDHESFVEDMKKLHPNIEIIGEYVNSSTKVKCKCKIDGYEWETTSAGLYSSNGCPKCGGISGLNAADMNAIFAENNMHIVSLSPGHVSQSKKSIFKCTNEKCGYEWVGIFSYVRKTGCPCCKKGDIPISQQEYNDSLTIINSPIIPIKYPTSMRQRTLHYCTKHDMECKTSPERTLAGGGCSKCRLEKVGAKKRIGFTTYVERLKDINPNIICIGEFKTTHENTAHRCLCCGYEWNPRPNSLLQGQGCPKCISSLGEKRIAEILTALNIAYQQQYRIPECKDKRALPFDFFVPSNGMLIEYQGRQHFQPSSFSSKSDGTKEFEAVKKRDLLKRNFCEANNIPLLIIPFWDYSKLEDILQVLFTPNFLADNLYDCEFVS